MTRCRIPEWWLMALAGWGARAGVEQWVPEPYYGVVITVAWFVVLVSIGVAIAGYLRGHDYQFHQHPVHPRFECPDCHERFSTVMAAEQHTFQPGQCLAEPGYRDTVQPATGLTAWYDRTWYARWFDRDPIAAWLALVVAISAAVWLGAALGSVTTFGLVLIGLPVGIVAHRVWRHQRG